MAHLYSRAARRMFSCEKSITGLMVGDGPQGPEPSKRRVGGVSTTFAARAHAHGTVSTDVLPPLQ